MRYFVTRVLLIFVGFVVIIVADMTIGRILNAPIIEGEADTFLDIRTRIRYTEPPAYFLPPTDDELYDVLVSPDEAYYLAIGLLPNGTYYMRVYPRAGGNKIAEFLPNEPSMVASTIWLGNEHLLLRRQLQLAANQQWSIYAVTTGTENFIGAYNEPPNPIVSPDGRWFVLQPKREEAHVTTSALVFAVDGSTTHSIHEILPINGWSPDSRWFAAVSVFDDGEQRFQMFDTTTDDTTVFDFPISMTATLDWASDSTLLLATDDTVRIVEAGEVTRQYEIEALRGAKISPGGEAVLLIEDDEADTIAVRLLTIADERTRHLGALPPRLHVGSVRWSSDGTQFTYRLASDITTSYIFDVATGESQPLITLPDLDPRTVIRMVDSDTIIGR